MQNKAKLLNFFGHKLQVLIPKFQVVVLLFIFPEADLSIKRKGGVHIYKIYLLLKQEKRLNVWMGIMAAYCFKF